MTEADFISWANTARPPDRAGRPCVTVIMPAYNAEATIGRALRSLVAQTLPNWEAVVVDDGSADRTWAEIEGWMARDRRVRGIRLPANLKAPGAANQAISAARGDWIAVVDADDWILPGRLAALVARGEQSGSDVVADNQILFDADAGAAVGTVLEVASQGYELTLDQYLAHCITGLSRFDHGMLKPIVRRQFLQRSGVRYEEGCHDGFDFHFMLDLLAAGAHAVVDHEPFYVYVQPFGTASRRTSHAGRMHYRYDLMRRYTDRAIVRYASTLAPASVRSLRRRSRGISRYAAYIAFKEALLGGAVGEALTVLARNPACLQPASVAVLVRLGLMRRIIPLPTERPDIAADLPSRFTPSPAT